MIEIHIVATHQAKGWPKPRSLEMRAAIRAPRVANDLTCPDQLDTNDHVEIHTRGIWYPAIVVRRDSDKIRVKFDTMSGNVQYATTAAHLLVPLGCGYSWRINSGFAEQWAAEVWRQRARRT